MAEALSKVFNQDIVFLNDKIDRFIDECNHSQSAGQSGINVHDQARLVSYCVALRFAHDWIQSVPLLDLPETHPKEFPLEAHPELHDNESEEINQVVRLLWALKTELVNSQSARGASRLNAHDSKRFIDIVTKIEKFLTDYVAMVEPLDLPESSPRESMTTPGRAGV
jgi:hypothetical protein